VKIFLFFKKAGFIDYGVALVFAGMRLNRVIIEQAVR